MLAREYRLTKEGEFELVKTKGKRLDTPLFTLLFLRRAAKGFPRFGFIVSTKISKKASIRNKVKRALREGVRHNIVCIKKGYDCVFLAKKPLAREYTQQIIAEVRKALSRAKLLKE